MASGAAWAGGRRILVIKLGALGDFVHAFHAFAAIRAHHAGDHVTLLTTAPFRVLGAASPWFDGVRVDPRVAWWNMVAGRRALLALQGFDFVYDLQTSGRSGRYFRALRRMGARPGWSGIAAGCSHPHANPGRDFIHTVERQREQLLMAGIPANVLTTVVPERAWFVGRGQRHGLEGRYVLLVPGGAGVGAVKRWPAARYAGLAAALAGRGIAPVVVGGAAEREVAAEIVAACPGAVDLTGRTSIEDVAALAAGAALVVGNDTGPVHVAASVGAPTVVVFSRAGVPAQAAPRGPRGEWVTVVQADDLGTLGLDRVLRAVDEALGGGGGGKGQAEA